MAGDKYALSLSVWIAILVCFAEILAVRSDADPKEDFSPNANGNFVFRDIFANGVITVGPGGTRAALSVDKFPALTDQSITYVLFKLKPCGENLPHTHPRATELITLISGGPLQAGFVDTSGVPHIYIIYPGDVLIFPRALLHFELNVGTEEALFVSALNSENPGVLIADEAVFQLPDRVIAGSLNTDRLTVSLLKRHLYPYSDSLQMDLLAGCIPGKDITTAF